MLCRTILSRSFNKTQHLPRLSKHLPSASITPRNTFHSVSSPRSPFSTRITNAASTISAPRNLPLRPNAPALLSARTALESQPRRGFPTSSFSRIFRRTRALFNQAGAPSSTNNLIHDGSNLPPLPTATTWLSRLKSIRQTLSKIFLVIFPAPIRRVFRFALKLSLGVVGLIIGFLCLVTGILVVDEYRSNPRARHRIWDSFLFAIGDDDIMEYYGNLQRSTELYRVNFGADPSDKLHRREPPSLDNENDIGAGGTSMLSNNNAPIPALLANQFSDVRDDNLEPIIRAELKKIQATSRVQELTDASNIGEVLRECYTRNHNLPKLQANLRYVRKLVMKDCYALRLDIHDLQLLLDRTLLSIQQIESKLAKHYPSKYLQPVSEHRMLDEHSTADVPQHVFEEYNEFHADTITISQAFKTSLHQQQQLAVDFVREPSREKAERFQHLTQDAHQKSMQLHQRIDLEALLELLLHDEYCHDRATISDLDFLHHTLEATRDIAKGIRRDIKQTRRTLAIAELAHCWDLAKFEDIFVIRFALLAPPVHAWLSHLRNTFSRGLAAWTVQCENTEFVLNALDLLYAQQEEQTPGQAHIYHHGSIIIPHEDIYEHNTLESTTDLKRLTGDFPIVNSYVANLYNQYQDRIDAYNKHEFQYYARGIRLDQQFRLEQNLVDSYASINRKQHLIDKNGAFRGSSPSELIPNGILSTEQLYSLDKIDNMTNALRKRGFNDAAKVLPTILYDPSKSAGIPASAQLHVNMFSPAVHKSITSTNQTEPAAAAENDYFFNRQQDEDDSHPLTPEDRQNLEDSLIPMNETNWFIFTMLHGQMQSFPRIPLRATMLSSPIEVLDIEDTLDANRALPREERRKRNIPLIIAERTQLHHKRMKKHRALVVSKTQQLFLRRDDSDEDKNADERFFLHDSPFNVPTRSTGDKLLDQANKLAVQYLPESITHAKSKQRESVMRMISNNLQIPLDDGSVASLSNIDPFSDALEKHMVSLLERYQRRDELEATKHISLDESLNELSTQLDNIRKVMVQTVLKQTEQERAVVDEQRKTFLGDVFKHFSNGGSPSDDDNDMEDDDDDAPNDWKTKSKRMLDAASKRIGKLLRQKQTSLLSKGSPEYQIAQEIAVDEFDADQLPIAVETLQDVILNPAKLSETLSGDLSDVSPDHLPGTALLAESLLSHDSASTYFTFGDDRLQPTITNVELYGQLPQLFNALLNRPSTAALPDLLQENIATIQETMDIVLSPANVDQLHRQFPEQSRQEVETTLIEWTRNFFQEQLRDLLCDHLAENGATQPQIETFQSQLQDHFDRSESLVPSQSQLLKLLSSQKVTFNLSSEPNNHFPTISPQDLPEQKQQSAKNEPTTPIVSTTVTSSSSPITSSASATSRSNNQSQAPSMGQPAVKSSRLQPGTRAYDRYTRRHAAQHQQQLQQPNQQLE